MMDLLAEREGYQHRIKSLEAQVLNLEQMIEDVDKEQTKAHSPPPPTPACSYFGGPSTTTPAANFNASNNSSNTQQEPQQIMSYFTQPDEVIFNIQWR